MFRHLGATKPADYLTFLNPKIKIQICCLYTFPIEVIGGEVVEISSKFILCDPVLNSHDHSVL